MKKAEKELQLSTQHRGLLKIEPDIKRAKEHIKKAEHYLEATLYLKEGNFSDICASTAFYAMYHALLAVVAKFGYESRNQECTFALISSLIDDKTISLDKETVNKVAAFNIGRSQESTSIEIREQYQYGIQLTLKDNLFKELYDLAKDMLSKVKVIIEE